MSTPILTSPEISRFRSSAPLREALKAELKLSGISAALAAIASTTKPRNIPGAIPGNHPDTAIAHEFYRMYGVQQVLSTLEALTVQPGKHDLEVGPTLDAFSTNLPPEFADPRPPAERTV
jgi:hypothetical protein